MLAKAWNNLSVSAGGPTIVCPNRGLSGIRLAGSRDRSRENRKPGLTSRSLELSSNFSAPIRISPNSHCSTWLIGTSSAAANCSIGSPSSTRRERSRAPICLSIGAENFTLNPNDRVSAWYFLKVLGVVFHTYSSPSEADHRAKTRNCGNELCRHNSATRAAFPPTARILRADFETGCFNRFLRQLYRLLSIRRSTPSAQRSGPRVTFEMRLEAGYRFFARPPPVLYGHVRMAQSPEFYRDADFPGRCGEGTRGVWDLWPIDEECGMRRMARDHRDALWAHVWVEPSLSTSEFAQRLPDDPPARGGGRH